MNNPPKPLTLNQERITELRQTRELTSDRALAQAMGMSQASMSRTLHGKQAPGPKFIAGLCTALGAPIDQLFQVR